MRKRVCILIGGLYKSINKQLLRGMLMQLDAMGSTPVVFTMGDDSEIEKISQGDLNLCRLICDELYDGVIFAPYTFSTPRYYEYIDRYLAAHCTLPVVRIGIEKKQIPVWYDDRYEMAKLTAHLIEAHGCKVIDCLTGPENLEVSHSRLAGFRDAMQAAGLTISPENEIFGDFWTGAAQQLVADIHSESHPKPDAVCCASDIMAIALCDALKDHGIRVPEDILVTGYDGYTEARVHIPAVTTYQTSQERLGITAVCKLYEAVTGKPVPPCANAEGKLLCRESCGCNSKEEKFDTQEFNYLQFTMDFLNTSLSAALHDVTSLAELRGQVYKKLYVFMENERWRHETFYMCLCEDWEQTEIQNDREIYRTEGYSENMTLLGETERISFPSAQLLPDGYTAGADQLMIVYPANFQDRCFGYHVMMIGRTLDSFNYNFLRFARELNNALEFLAVQNKLKSLAYLQQMTESRDALTGLYKSQESDTIINDMIRQAQHSGKLIYFVALKIRGEGAYRDSYGAVAYDRFLVAFADLVKGCCVHQEQVFLTGSDLLYVVGQESTMQLHHPSCEKRLIERFASLKEKNPNYPEIAVSAKLLIPDAELFHKSEEQLCEWLNTAKKPVHFHEVTALHTRIYSEPEKHWTLESCAELVGLTPAHFGQVYKSILGESCRTDIRRSRLQYAKLLLLTTDQTLDAIAAACGYDYAYFMRVFKKETGMTPLRYKESM